MSNDTMFSEAFDPATEEPTPPRSLLPAGKYRAEVIDGSISETKNGKGTMLNLTWSITSGEYDHRLAFQSILVRHESPEAQRYGRYKLKDLCDACGITDAVTDITVFYHKPCTITLGIEKDKEGVYPDKNKVTRIASIDIGATAKPYTPPNDPRITTGTQKPKAATNSARKPGDNSDLNDELPGWA